MLRADGSMWVHCDDCEQAAPRVLMDELFGRQSHLATVVWQRRYSCENRLAFSRTQDYIHVYAPSGSSWKEHRNRLARTDKPGTWSNPDGDPRADWSTVSLIAQGGHATVGQDYSTHCHGCDAPLQGRRRQWCSDACRKRHARAVRRLTLQESPRPARGFEPLDRPDGRSPTFQVGAFDRSARPGQGIARRLAFGEAPKSMRTNGLADPVRLLSRLLLAGNRPQPRQVHAKAPRHRLLSASVRARVRFGPPTSRSG